LEKKLLDHVFGGGAATASAYTPPSPLYVAVYTTAPTDSSTGTAGSGGGVELTIGTFAYARVAVTNNVANWPNASGTTATKVYGGASAVAFPAASGGNWGTIVAFSICDAATAGQMLWWGAVNSPTGKVINDGDTLSFPVTTGLTFTLD
jgi:hypothetical protein